MTRIHYYTIYLERPYYTADLRHLIIDVIDPRWHTVLDDVLKYQNKRVYPGDTWSIDFDRHVGEDKWVMKSRFFGLCKRPIQVEHKIITDWERYVFTMKQEQ